MKKYLIPVNENQAKAYKLVAMRKDQKLTSSSKEEMERVAQEFGALGLTKWQALSLSYNYFKKDTSIPVKEKMMILKESVLHPKSTNVTLKELKEKKEKPFWTIDSKKGQAKIIIEPSDLVKVLSELGYYKFSKSKTGYVKLEGKIITEATIDQMQESVKEYLYKIPAKKLKRIKKHDEVWEFIINKKYLFRNSTSSFLPTLMQNFHRDKQDEINLYLKTGYLRITSDSIQFKSYVEMNGVIWSQSIVKAPFSELDYRQSDYEKFLSNTQKNHKKRIDNAMKALAYLMHRYNFQSKMKVTYFVDELISVEANGGTGKNLTLELLKFIRSMVTINGKRLNLKNRFAFQMVEDYHDIILLNDVRDNLDQKDLYPDTTEGIQVEKKGENATAKDNTNTGKIALTGNRRKISNEGSTRRRTLTVPYSNYYSEKFTVADDFGRELFVDFNQTDWNQTLTFAVRCCQLYLEEGLPESKSMEVEMLEINTSCEFVEFMDSVVANEIKINRSKLRIRFEKVIKQKIGNKEFCRWGEEYFRVKNILTKGYINSNGKTYANKTGDWFYTVMPNK